MFRRFIILSSLLFSLACAWAGSVHLSIEPQRGKRSIEVGDMFYLYVKVSDISARPNQPSLPGAKLIYFEQTGSESRFESVNGVSRQSSSVIYTATFRALKEGSYSFGPINVGGAKSNQVKYAIGAPMPQNNTPATPSGGNAKPAPDGSDKPKYIGKGDGNLFLRANVSSSSAYEQQAIVYTVKLYTTYDAIKFIGATSAPKFDGFVVEESKEVSNSLSYETYEGKTYATAVIARYIIFPQMTGSLKVTGNTYTISVDRREYYHDSYYGSMSFAVPMQLNVTPNDLVINVKALPTPKPADFSGAVGDFSISSSLPGSQFKTNQAASIVYKVQGTGNIKYVQLPDLSALFPADIEIYTPKNTQDVKVGASSVSGSVSFDYSFMPLEEGTFKIPDVKLIYFDPVAEEYKTSVAKGYTINVGKGAGSKSARRNHLRFEQKLLDVDTDDLRLSRSPMVYSFSYWLWYILPVVILLTSFIFYHRYVSLHADMVAFNSRRANKMARRRLRKANAAIRQNDHDRFYDELLLALWGYLGDKLKMPTSELMRDNVRQVLVEKSISSDTIDLFIRIIDDAEFAKYSPAAAGQTIKEAYQEAADIIDRLEKEFKK